MLWLSTMSTPPRTALPSASAGATASGSDSSAGRSAAIAATRPARARPGASAAGHAAKSGDASAGEPSTAVAWLAVTSFAALRERGGRRLRERERMRGVGARNTARALPGERQQRIGRDARRPALGGHAGQPQRVELESRRLEHAEDLDARGRRLRLEHDARDQRAQRVHGVVARERAHQPAERGERAQRLEQARARLPFGAGERPVAGPPERREPRAPRVGPGGRRRARRLRRGGAAPARGQRVAARRRQAGRPRARTARRADRPRARTASIAARRCHSCAASGRYGERSTIAAASSGSGDDDHSTSASAVATIGTSASRVPSEIAYGRGTSVPGCCASSGHRRSSAAATTSGRRSSRSPTTIATRTAGSASIRARASTSAAASSACGDAHATRRTHAGPRPRQRDVRDARAGRGERGEQPALLPRRLEKPGEHDVGVAPRRHRSRDRRERVGGLRGVDRMLVVEMRRVPLRPAGERGGIVGDAGARPRRERFVRFAPRVEQRPGLARALRRAARVEQRALPRDDAIPQERRRRLRQERTRIGERIGGERVEPQRLLPRVPRQHARRRPRPETLPPHRVVVLRRQRARKPVVGRHDGDTGGERRRQVEGGHRGDAARRRAHAAAAVRATLAGLRRADRRARRRAAWRRRRAVDAAAS